ncbi:hypothetical protein WMY93_017353 [Mugilogobius chulae]|uniref:Proline rich membrane anchor 1 n=1 Tax=Mugilogobius chulae TaxID=88201 RepID=A0AAW0NV20_9GOBI
MPGRTPEKIPSSASASTSSTAATATGPPVVEPMVPLVRPWWSEMDFIVLGTVGCASLLFLLSAIIICYKAIKRKPLRKEENGTSRGEYAMSIRNKKAMGTNNTVV